MEYGGKIIMETLLEILNDIDDTVNWEDETALIDDRILLE